MDEMVDKECETCSVCCEVLGVSFPEYKKPAQSRCQHQSPYGGCQIYDDRPNPCKTFYCSWLLMPMMPDRCRPDRLGVLFQFFDDEDHWSPFSKGCVIAYASGDRASLKHKDTLAAFSMFWNGGTPVWVQGADGVNVLVDEEGRKIAGSRYDQYLTKLKQE